MPVPWTLSCAICVYIPLSSSDLEIHEQLKHRSPLVDVKSVTVLSCSECSYTCRLNIQLRKHIKLNHESEAKFQCDKCRYVSTSSTNIRLHFAANHHHISIDPETRLDKNSINEELQSLKYDFDKRFKKLDTLMGIGLDKILSDSNDKYTTLTETLMKVNRKVNLVGR